MECRNVKAYSNALKTPTNAEMAKAYSKTLKPLGWGIITSNPSGNFYQEEEKISILLGLSEKEMFAKYLPSIAKLPINSGEKPTDKNNLKIK